MDRDGSLPTNGSFDNDKMFKAVTGYMKERESRNQLIWKHSSVSSMSTPETRTEEGQGMQDRANMTSDELAKLPAVTSSEYAARLRFIEQLRKLQQQAWELACQCATTHIPAISEQRVTVLRVERDMAQAIDEVKHAPAMYTKDKDRIDEFIDAVADLQAHVSNEPILAELCEHVIQKYDAAYHPHFEN